MAKTKMLLETDFKKKYPNRDFDFWYHWTEGYVEFEATHKYKVLDWLSNDSERIKALEEIKAEVINRLPAKYPKRAEILEFVECKIEEIKTHIEQASANQK